MSYLRLARLELPLFCDSLLRNHALNGFFIAFSDSVQLFDFANAWSLGNGGFYLIFQLLVFNFEICGCSIQVPCRPINHMQLTMNRRINLWHFQCRNLAKIQLKLLILQTFLLLNSTNLLNHLQRLTTNHLRTRVLRRLRVKPVRVLEPIERSEPEPIEELDILYIVVVGICCGLGE